MFAPAPQPPIFAPEGLSWEFPSRADRGTGAASDPGRLGGAPADGRRARLAPAARQAASAAKGAVLGATAIARELLLLVDPELEAQAARLARADDSSGSRAGGTRGCGAPAPRLERPRNARMPQGARRPGTALPAPDAHACVSSTPRG
jgi:hypothetical protein